MLSMILGFGLLMGVYIDRDARLGSERGSARLGGGQSAFWSHG
jgi:hypothetical protein